MRYRLKALRDYFFHGEWKDHAEDLLLEERHRARMRVLRAEGTGTPIINHLNKDLRESGLWTHERLDELIYQGNPLLEKPQEQGVAAHTLPTNTTT